MTEAVKKRIVFITGATGGIGSALANELAGPNTILILLGNRRFDELERFARSLREKSAGVETFRADLVSEAEQDRFCDHALDWLDRVNPEGVGTLAWINAAGLDLMAADVKETSFDEKMRRLFALDVTAAIRMSRRVGLRMTELAMLDWMDNPTHTSINSSILFFGWDGVSRGMEGESAQLYAAAKGAVIAYAKSLAQDLAPFVRVLSISPGWIVTEWGKQASNRAIARGRNESLLGRWGRPEEVAAFAAFLISEKGRYLNGQNIEINGGFDCRPKLNSKRREA